MQKPFFLGLLPRAYFPGWSQQSSPYELRRDLSFEWLVRLTACALAAFEPFEIVICTLVVTT